MLSFESREDEQFLRRALERGEVVLILGAGASASSTNRHGDAVPLAPALAHHITEYCGQDYNQEKLTDVLSAMLGAYLSEIQLHKILFDLYCSTIPSDELQELFKYTWKRVYTFNIDDTIENLRRGVQRRIYYNGLIDRVSEPEHSEIVQIIHLHGDALKPEHGFILTEDQYNRWLVSQDHAWYQKLAEDYASFTPVFIGSTLQEPILSAELHRAREQVNSGLGRAFLITPEPLTAVRRGAFRARNLVAVTGHLSDFSGWLDRTFAQPITPVDVATELSKFARQIVGKYPLSLFEIEAAQAIYPIDASAIGSDVGTVSAGELRKLARSFLEGAPPTWRIAGSSIPVWLDATNDLYRDLVEGITERVRLFLVHGQAGSGKTTAVLQCLLRLSREQPALPIYELRGDVRSLPSALKVLMKIHPEDHVVVHIADAFVFGDSFGRDLLGAPAGRITVVSSARSGEWKDHLERRLGGFTVAHKFERFSRPDYQPLIERLIAYVPAPKFLKMTEAERISKLSKSRSQLLIALRETTEAENFNRVITSEFNDLPDDDCRALVLIAGVATLARVGISVGAAREAYGRLGKSRLFDEALRAVTGIVLEEGRSRVIARHELYVRHIIENVADLSFVIQVVIESLRTFTKYRHPVYKSVERYDGLLFRFLLNHNFVKELVRDRTQIERVLEIYKSFELEFQLDGHFWLQYGQFLVEMGRPEAALVVLRKSIDAYPNNEFARHSLAGVQLKVARRRQDYDAETRQLIGEAVQALLEQDTRLDIESDIYPIVTLTFGHIGALMRHRQRDKAGEVAVQYFDRVQQLHKRRHDRALEHAMEVLLRFKTTGDWSDEMPAPGDRVHDKLGRHRRQREGRRNLRK